MTDGNMERKYASTFISGLQEVVKDMLIQLFPNVEIIMLMDGLVVYQGNIPPDALKRACFLNNTFVILDVFKDLPANPLHTILTAVSRDKNLERKIHTSIEAAETGKTFRIVASDENRSVAIKESLRQTLESRISKVKSLRVNRAKPDFEFWFLYRSEGYGFFMKRITTHTAYEKTLERGELRPELAYTLCFLSEPRESDVFLDPFCGHGAIPLKRALSFPYNMIFASDKDQEQIQFVRKRLKKTKVKSTFIMKKQNALSMAAFEDGFIDKIVTDPPWGIFQNLDMEIREFYSLMLREFSRVLRANGILVILTARKEEFESALSSMGTVLKLLNQYDILVSGKKAAIYKILKLR
jgi:tRNA (guanine6-N2)-methyltransferase